MSLIFYYAPWSSAVTCLWALEELQIPHERVKVDLATKGTHTPAFLKLNPNGKVPLLVHDGVPVFESIAILAHLGETFGVEKRLFPPPGLARAQALQWLAWGSVSLGGAVSRYLTSSSEAVPADMRNAKAAAAAKEEVDKLLGISEGALAGKSWLVGDTFTFADAHIAGALGWMSTFGFGTETLPNVDAWMTRCKARPAFAVAMAP